MQMIATAQVGIKEMKTMRSQARELDLASQ